MNTVKVNIKKPLFGTFVNIREKYINKAISEGKMLEVTIPQGTAIVDPRKWREGGKKTEQVFKYPNRPMVLYGNYVPLEGVPKVKEPVSKNQMGLL